MIYKNHLIEKSLTGLYSCFILGVGTLKADSLEGIKRMIREAKKVNLSYNQEISFRLDNSWSGKGLIKVINSHSVEVELLTECKEFPVGAMIIVDKAEIVPDYDPVDFMD